MEKREFKVGDKVKLPKTKNTGMSINNERIQRHLANSKFDYMTIKHIYSDKTLVGAIHTEMEGEQNWNFKAEDLEHYEEFVLPKCWFVLYNSQEEFHIINQFYGKGWAYCNYENKCGYHNNGDNQMDTNNWVGESITKEKLLKNGYVQITFQQFQKHILKQETMGKEIEGYVLIKEYPGSKGLGYFEKYTTGELNKYPEFWKPVYKEEKQIIQMYSSNKGMFEIEVVDGKAYYRPENKELPKEWIKNIINIYGDILISKNNVNPYSVEVETISVGCYHGTKKSDWEKVYKLLS